MPLGKVNPKLPGQGNIQLDSRIATSLPTRDLISLFGYSPKGPSIARSTSVYSGGNIVMGEGASISTTGGYGSTIVGWRSSVTGSQGTALGSLSAAVGGATAIGTSVNVSGANGVGVGNTLSVTGTSAVAVGFNSTAGATGATAMGNTVNASNTGAVAIGSLGLTEFSGEVAFSTGNFAAAGDVKNSLFSMWLTTTTATPAELKTGTGAAATSPSGVIVLTNNSTYIFDVDIVARRSATGTDYSAWNLKFCINREANAGSTALVGTVTKTLIGQTAGASTWDVGATADTSAGRPTISVTGQASTTIRWVGFARMTKCLG